MVRTENPIVNILLKNSELRGLIGSKIAKTDLGIMLTR